MAYPCYAWSAATPLILSRRAATRQPQAATPVEPSLADTRPRLALRYHRAMSYGGFNFFQKVTMPDYCPPYYWLDASRLEAFAWPTREPSFLDNPRTPAALGDDSATLHLCTKVPCTPSAAAKPAGRGGSARQLQGLREVRHPGRTTLAALLPAAARLSAARVLHVEHLHALVLPPSEMPQPPRTKPPRGATLSWDESLHALSHTMWCSPCPITRRGAVIGEFNRSVRRDLEHFCRVEARARLSWPGYEQRSCCGQHHDGCRVCFPRERRTANESQLPWHVRSWLPKWARLRDPPAYAAAGPAWRCAHPLCTGTDRVHFP